MSRMLAAKASLATRVDALGEDGNFDLGAEHKVKLENRLRLLEEGNLRKISGTGKAKAKFEKYHNKSEIIQYPAAADTTMKSAKRKYSEIEEKRPLIEEIDTNAAQAESEEIPIKKKKKNKQTEESGESTVMEVADVSTKIEEITETDKDKKKKKKKNKESQEEIQEAPTIMDNASDSTIIGKKKKKKKKSSQD